MVKRTLLSEMDLNLGKRTRLHRLLYDFGPGSGHMLFLPIDQGFEHGPVDFFSNPASEDPDYQCRLALQGGYSGIVFHVGLAHKYMSRYAGAVPLVLKINGKTTIPSDDNAFSSLAASVEDAVRLGADAVGYTLYVGSPSQAEDIAQFGLVRAECERYGMPTIVWSYPRGSAIEAKGGRDSLYAVDYAARVACELGADVVKINEPDISDPRNAESPKAYAALYQELKALPLGQGMRLATERVVASAGKTMVLFSGGSRLNDDDLMERARICLESGATGLIFGRNMWQRPFDEGLAMTARIKALMAELG